HAFSSSSSIRLAFVFRSLFFHATAPTEIYTLSLHDALPISEAARQASLPLDAVRLAAAHVARHRAQARHPVRGGIVPDAHHRSGEPRREPHARQGYFQPCARQPRGGGLLGPAGGVAVFGVPRGFVSGRCYLLIRE